MKWRSVVPGVLLVSIVVIAALVSYLWTPFDVTDLDIRNKMQGSSSSHWLGTDHFGRDILSMLMVGARTSIAVALVAVGIGMGIGVPCIITHVIPDARSEVDKYLPETSAPVETNILLFYFLAWM